MAPRRKTRRGRSSRKQKTQRGRGRIMQTSTISIFRPPLKCKDGSNVPYQSNAYIGKIVKQDTAVRTAQLIELLKLIDPLGEYTIPPVLFCELAPEQNNNNAKNELFTGQNYKFQEIQRFGGISLHKRLENLESLANVVLPLKQFFDKLGLFNRQFIHKDLHTDNVVWDGSVYKMIDFETMVPMATVETVIRDDIEMYKNETIEQNIIQEQTNLYMKNYDMMTLTDTLINDLTKYYSDDSLAQGFVALIGQQETIPESIITHYGLKDYRAAFKILFDELRT